MHSRGYQNLEPATCRVQRWFILIQTVVVLVSQCHVFWWNIRNKLWNLRYKPTVSTTAITILRRWHVMIKDFFDKIHLYVHLSWLQNVLRSIWSQQIDITSFYPVFILISQIYDTTLLQISFLKYLDWSPCAHQTLFPFFTWHYSTFICIWLWFNQ